MDSAGKSATTSFAITLKCDQVVDIFTFNKSQIEITMLCKSLKNVRARFILKDISVKIDIMQKSILTINVQHYVFL